MMTNGTVALQPVETATDGDAQPLHDPVAVATGLSRDFAARVVQHDRTATFPRANYEQIKHSGLINMAIPRELGGGGCDLPDIVGVLSALAQGCPSTALAFTMHLSATGQLGHLWRVDPGGAWEPWLRRWCAGRLAVGGTLSESKSWNAVMFPQAPAVRVARGFIVNGDRGFCTGSEVLDEMQCTATHTTSSGEKRGIYFIIPPGTPGVEFKGDWDTMGMRASASQGVRLSDVFVPDSAVLYDYAYGTADASQLWLSFLTWSFLGFSSIYLGIAAAARDFAVGNVAERKRAPGTHPLSHKPTTLIRTAEMDITLAAMRALCETVARRYAGHEEMPIQAVIDAAIAKQFVVTNAVKVVDSAIAIVGGQSYYRRFPLERMWRDVRAGGFHPFSAEDSLELLGKVAFGLPLVEPTGWAM